MRKKTLIEETTMFPAFDIKAGEKIWLGCTDDLVIDIIHHTDEPHEDGYNVMVTVNQPSRQIVDAEMLLVSVDVDDWAELTISHTANDKTGARQVLSYHEPGGSLMLLPNSKSVEEQVMTLKKIKAHLVDIEVCALELSTGNFEADTFVSDCEHIAHYARELRDYLTPEAEEET